MLKISIEGHDRAEPPIIVTPTSSTASPIPPKYLELIHDDHDDHQLNLHHHPQHSISIISNGYEIPLADDDDEVVDHFPCTNFPYCCDTTSSISSTSNTNSLGGSRHHQHLSHHHNHFDPATDDRRHHSVGSSGDKERTFSSSSTVSEHSDLTRNEQPLCAATILKVALPNTKEDCGSHDALLMEHQQRCHNHFATDLYAKANKRDAQVLACGETKTMM